MVVDFAFNPATTNINLNDWVKWAWNCSFQHNAVDTGANGWTSQTTSGTTAPYFHQFTTAGSYPYVCTIHSFSGTINVAAPNSPPSVSLTNPANGATFSAPASIMLEATASDAEGPVANVKFFEGNTLLGTVTAGPPYTFIAANVPAGNTNFSAVATDSGGLTATNTITVHVVTATPITLSGAQRLSATNFQFSYSANPGLRYVAQRSFNLTDWLPLATNTAASASVLFQDNNATGNPSFYRIGRLPNP
jgi:hypothetical protein